MIYLYLAVTCLLNILITSIINITSLELYFLNPLLLVVAIPFIYLKIKNLTKYLIIISISSLLIYFPEKLPFINTFIFLLIANLNIFLINKYGFNFLKGLLLTIFNLILYNILILTTYLIITKYFSFPLLMDNILNSFSVNIIYYIISYVICRIKK